MIGTETISDFAAIDEVVRGNREMFEVLVRRHNQRLFRVGMACLKRRELVEDAMQNAYLKAFLHLPRFRRTASFGTWLTRIMVNECRMLLRKQRSAREDEWMDHDHAATPDEAVEPAGHTLSLNEMKNLLEKTIGELPRNYRSVYMLREIEQLSTAETAESLGISPDNVKVILHRAREQLKTRLLESAAGPELFRFDAPQCDPFTARVMALVRAIATAP